MIVTRGGLLLILLFCLGTALAVAVSGREADVSVVAAIETRSEKAHADLIQGDPHQNPVTYNISAVKRVMPDGIQSSELLGARSWYTQPTVAPQVALVSLLPQIPSAPPLPFTFLDRMIDAGEVTVFLLKDEQQYIAKLNDVLNDTYRLDQITATSAVFTYIPLNVQQTLAFNSNAVGSSSINDAMAVTASPSTVQYNLTN